MLHKKSELAKSKEVWESEISGSLQSDFSNAHDSLVPEKWENQLNMSSETKDRRNTE